MKGKAHKEIAQLGRSLHKRRRDILAFFDRGVSNGPVEAINGRLEHLRGIALGLKKPQPLHLAMPHPLRRPHQQNQRTLKPEEPGKTDRESHQNHRDVSRVHSDNRKHFCVYQWRNHVFLLGCHRYRGECHHHRGRDGAGELPLAPLVAKATKRHGKSSDIGV